MYMIFSVVQIISHFSANVGAYSSVQHLNRLTDNCLSNPV